MRAIKRNTSMKKPFVISLIFALLSLTLFTQCKKGGLSNDFMSVTIDFDYLFGGAEFAYNTAYVTDSGEELTFTNVKHYISNIVFERTDGTTWSERESYHLVSPVEDLITVDSVPFGNYNKIHFMIGVDSIRNNSGAQEGALDPANTMFWSWNSGYIFFKLEGTSPASGMGSFSYHIGGYQAPYIASQSLSLDFSVFTLALERGGYPIVQLMVDVKRAFDGKEYTHKVSDKPMIHMPGEEAQQLSINFGQAFRFDHLHN